jgi:hypothetical protein
MWLDPPPRGGQDVHIPAQLKDPAGGFPPSKLAPHVGRIPVAGQQQTAAKDRQIAHGLQKLGKMHGVKMPTMAIICNGTMC